MYVLDTDTTSHLFSGRNEVLNRRVLAVADRDIWLPIIVVQEQLNGRLGSINKLNPNLPKDSKNIPTAYANLIKTQEFLARFQILPYTSAEEDLLQSWSKSTKLIGATDRRIAAIAVNRGFVVVTCNSKDFQKIPGVKYVDWTIDGS